jgi:hypothetical protein
MDRYDAFTLKKIRDSRTDEEPRPHSSTRLFLVLVKSNAKRSVPSLRHRGILLGKTTHPSRLHTLCQIPQSSWQNFTRLTVLTVNRNCCCLLWIELAEILLKKEKHFLFYKKKSLPILFFYPMSILRSKVKHNGSIHKYTQLVMFSHYSPRRGWLPSVTLGHKHYQTPSSTTTTHLSDTRLFLLETPFLITKQNRNV